MTINDLPNRCLIVFSSTTCLKCKELKASVAEANLEIDVIELDNNVGQEIGSHYGIMMAPTTILVENKREIDRFYGVKSPEKICEFAK